MFANSQMIGVDGVSRRLSDAKPGAGARALPGYRLAPTAIPNAFNILFVGTPAHNMATVTPLTNGDNPGVATGVASGTVMGPSRHLTGAFTVLLKGTPATRLTNLSLQNSTNALGMRIVPSQLKVLLLAP